MSKKAETKKTKKTNVTLVHTYYAELSPEQWEVILAARRCGNINREECKSALFAAIHEQGAIRHYQDTEAKVVAAAE
jgi:predicted transcriptional regulator